MKLPPSLHSMLVHAGDVQDLLPFSLGESSEEGLESSHKRKRYIREFHTRKNSREHTIRDVFQKDLQETDPVLLDKSLKEQFKTKHESLNSEMLKLIECEIL